MTTSGSEKTDADRSPIERIREEIRRMRAQSAESPTIPKVSKGDARLKSIDRLPESISERTRVLITQGRDPTQGDPLIGERLVMRVCCDLLRAGVNDELIFGILFDDRFEISSLVKGHGNVAERFALHTIAKAKEFAIDPRLVELNDRHAVIENYNGHCRILEEVPDHRFNDRPILTFQTFDDFRNRYQHRKVTGYSPKGQPVQTPLGSWWIDHPARRQYRNITFSPGREIDGAYNLWRGFAIEPVKGDKHKSYLEHIHANLCGKNDTIYAYLISWMARAVQQPNSPGEVAIVLRGKKGTGKSLFARTFGSLFGRHYWAVSDARHIVGNFNAHLRDCVILFGDEAFWAGDKRHESVLKTIITEETIIVERKGVDAETVPNNVHLIMASNAQWVVPASYDERRFLVLDVSADRMQDKKYFATIDTDLKNGGLANLLYALKTFDLKNFDHRTVPSTEALQDQKLHSMESHEEWWFRKLCNGHLQPAHSEWDAPIPKEALINDYLLYAQRIGTFRRTNGTQLERFLKKCTPSLEDFVASFRGRDSDGNPQIGRAAWWKFPPIAACREGFAQHMGGTFTWPEIKIRIESPQQPPPPPPPVSETAQLPF